MTEQIFDVHFLLETFPKIMPYYPITMAIVGVALVFGLLIGFFCALIRIYHVRILTTIVNIYISIVRGTPLLIQLYLFYYGIPISLRLLNAKFQTNFNIDGVSPLWCVLISYSLNEGAYQTETIRGAIESVDQGEVEAAYSIGLTGAQTLRRIIIPEAVKIAIPNLGNNLLKLFKNTSLAFTVSVVDIMAEGKLIGSEGYRYFEVYIALAVIYWVSCFVISKVVDVIELRVNVAGKRIAR
ncbi:amino acid ABC transporter permease [Lacticaseibacillus baoqingensis]|uniref:Amino acid ABC transporter permease n=1 Tax=Lacticaseibacillus baoqingensis TaxID=2486013 RepID=A0ABW4EBZ9_9LACO|nr:amino acid ABC transporter permease [Lacticaseibacillus baoqingensis]